MLHSLPRLLLLPACGLAASALAAAQYASDFEAVTASAGGTVLTGQDGYYVPAGTTSVDFNAYTYAGNTLGVSANPGGGANFVAGTGPAGGAFARAQRDITWGTGLWSVAYDACGVFGGTLPTAQNLGSFSIQPFPGSQALIQLCTWSDVNTATAWDADYIWFDAAGTQLTESIPDPAFQNLPVGEWFRVETIVDLTTNQVVEVRITDLVGGTTASHSPVDRYLLGGAAGSTPPTGFRFFGGGGVAGNTLCFDNAAIEALPDPLAPDILHYTFDAGDATNSASGSVGDGTPRAQTGFGAGGMCAGTADPAAISLLRGADCRIDTGWTPALGGGDWTVGTWVDWTAATTTGLQYIFGTLSPGGNFRCFTNGVAGGDLWLRGPQGDVILPGGGVSATGPILVVFCHDSTAGEVRAYLNGQLAATRVTAGFSIDGTAPFEVMGYPGSNANSIDTGVIIDDFRFYGRCLPESEILGWLACGFREIGTKICSPAVANSTGVPGVLTANGSTIAALNSLQLAASDLPLDAFGFFLASTTQDNVPMSGGSSGTLCLGGMMGRGVGGVILNSGASGGFSVFGDLTMQPQPTGPVAVAPGETWYYQCWYRDVGMPATSNFTDAVCITYE